MKKIISLILVLVMAFAAAVVAENVSSPVIGDLTSIDILTTLPAGNVLVISEDTSDDAKELVAAEVEKMGDNTTEYFKADEAIAAVIGEGEYTVDEMIELFVSGYEESYGEIEVAMSFITAYEAGEKVAVMFGILDETDINNTEINWTVIEGVASESGAVVFTFTADQLIAAQEGTALIATISK